LAKRASSEPERNRSRRLSGFLSTGSRPPWGCRRGFRPPRPPLARSSGRSWSRGGASGTRSSPIPPSLAGPT
jgi:hypothetical protein